MFTSSFINICERHFESLANPSYAPQMKAYLKGHFEFYGIKATPRRAVFKDLWKTDKADIKTHWAELVEALWQKEQREFQHLAMDILAKMEKSLTVDDLPLIERLITSKSWWDTVDFLATHCVGRILKNDQELRYEAAQRYLDSSNMWLNRTSLIFQLFYKEKTEEDLLFAMIISQLGSKEFFINKAIGWSLRQYSKTNKGAVSAFVDIHKQEMANLSIREATKYL